MHRLAEDSKPAPSYKTSSLKLKAPALVPDCYGTNECMHALHAHVLLISLGYAMVKRPSAVIANHGRMDGSNIVSLMQHILMPDQSYQ